MSYKINQLKLGTFLNDQDPLPNPHPRMAWGYTLSRNYTKESSQCGMRNHLFVHILLPALQMVEHSIQPKFNPRQCNISKYLRTAYVIAYDLIINLFKFKLSFSHYLSNIIAIYISTKNAPNFKYE